MLDRIEARIKAFKRGCFDFVARVELTDSGYVVHNGQLLTLSPRAKQQVCRIVGCTPAFLDLLSDEGYASVCNAFLEEDLLVRCRDMEVRAILPARTGIDYESVASVCSGMKLTYLDDDFMILEGVGNPRLVVLSSETGYCSVVCSLLKFKLSSGYVLKKARVSYMDTDKMNRVLNAAKNDLAVLEGNINRVMVRFRKIDLKILPYSVRVKQRLIGSTESEVTYRDLVANAKDISSIRDRLIVQCDLFDVGLAPSRYIKDGGYLIKWPMRANWLRI